MDGLKPVSFKSIENDNAIAGMNLVRRKMGYRVEFYRKIDFMTI